MGTLREGQKRALDWVLQKFPAVRQSFRFTGGTALYTLYLGHRESRDLDFLGNHSGACDYVASRWVNDEVVATPIFEAFGQVTYEVFGIRVDFLESPFLVDPPEERDLEGERLLCDTLREIYARKIWLLTRRTAPQDIVDLAFIAERLGPPDFAPVKIIGLDALSLALGHIRQQEEILMDGIRQLKIITPSPPEDYLKKVYGLIEGWLKRG